MRLRPFRRVALAVVLPLSLIVLSGCAEGTGTKGYVDGDGVVRQIQPADRKPVGTVAGEKLGGGTLDLADYRGKVVVLNLWWSLCPPCRAEQPMLAGAARDLMARGVAVMGINTRDAAQSGPMAYQRSFKVPYPSIFDPDGQTLLAFRSYVSPNAIPSTLVIDKEGRVAAVVLGELPSRTTLLDLVQDAGGPKVTQKATQKVTSS